MTSYECSPPESGFGEVPLLWTVTRRTGFCEASGGGRVGRGRSFALQNDAERRRRRSAVSRLSVPSSVDAQNRTSIFAHGLGIDRILLQRPFHVGRRGFRM